MKTAKIIFFTVFGILFSITAVGLVYVAITFLSAASVDKMLIFFAPMFLLIYTLPLLIAEAELFFFFRPRGNRQILITDIITVILSLIVILLTAVWVIFRSNYLHDMVFASSGLFLLIHIILKISKAVQKVRKDK